MPTLELKESLPIGVELKFNNIYTESGNGAKTAYVHWDQPLLKFDLSRAIPETYESIKTYLIDFFKEVKGAETIFRYSDPTDNYVTASVKTGFATDKSWGIGVKNSDGSQYQLFKVYELEGVRSYRPITKPVQNVNFKIFNGTTQITTGFTVNYVTGVITFSPAQPSLNLLWQGNFDVPCRFSSDAIAFITEVAAKEECQYALYSIPSFEILEVREPAVAHPTAPVLPERIKHELALDVNVKEQDELTLNTSITVFDSGFEVRQANCLETVSNQLQPKVYRKFTTGEITKADDVDLHYMLCLWRCTRGGAIVFQHQKYEVQARETLNIDVQLEEVDEILYPNCKRIPVYNFGSVSLIEASDVIVGFLAPPNSVPLTAMSINPLDSSSLSAPTNSGNSYYDHTLSPSSFISQGGFIRNSNLRYSLLRYIASNVSFDQLPPGEIGSNIKYIAIALFWAANTLYVLITTSNTASIYRHRYICYALDLTDGWSFKYQSSISSLLRNYIIPSQDKNAWKTPTGTSVFSIANNQIPFGGTYSSITNGLLRFEIKNDGTPEITFLSNNLISPMNWANIYAVYGNNVWIAGSLTNKLLGSFGGLTYYANVEPTSSGNPVGFPISNNSQASDRNQDLNIWESPSLESNNSRKIYLGTEKILEYFPRTSTSTGSIFVTTGDDGSYLIKIIAIVCTTGQFGCITSDSSVLVFFFHKESFDSNPVLIDVQKRITSPSSGHSHYIQNFFTETTSVSACDRLGNMLIISGNRAVYYKAGTGYGIDITNQLGFAISNSNIRFNPACTPYGFAIISDPNDIFSTSIKLAFIQNKPEDA
ncbi:MAG: DUF2460 domain-containing protein [Waterburya sp.]